MIHYFTPAGAPTECPHPPRVQFPPGDDGYTVNPTTVRMYREDTGDEWPWHLDGVDGSGHYTEACERYASEGEALANVERFVAEHFRTDVHFTSVNEEGDVYDHHPDIDSAVAMLRRFPNDMVVVTLGKPFTP